MFLTCDIAGGRERADDLLDVHSALHNGGLSVLGNGDVPQQCQVDLKAVELAQRAGKAMSTVDGKERKAVAVGVFDLVDVRPWSYTYVSGMLNPRLLQHRLP